MVQTTTGTGTISLLLIYILKPLLDSGSFLDPESMTLWIWIEQKCWNEVNTGTDAEPQP
jgi:hypothetical protein